MTIICTLLDIKKKFGLFVCFARKCGVQVLFNPFAQLVFVVPRQ